MTQAAQQNEVRRAFDAAASAHRASGALDKAAQIEIAREFFTNSDFRRALEDHIWEISSGARR